MSGKEKYFYSSCGLFILSWSLRVLGADMIVWALVGILSCVLAIAWMDEAIK